MQVCKNVPWCQRAAIAAGEGLAGLPADHEGTLSVQTFTTSNVTLPTQLWMITHLLQHAHIGLIGGRCHLFMEDVALCKENGAMQLLTTLNMLQRKTDTGTQLLSMYACKVLLWRYVVGKE